MLCKNTIKMIDKCLRFLQNYKNDYNKKDIAIYKYHQTEKIRFYQQILWMNKRCM